MNKNYLKLSYDIGTETYLRRRFMPFFFNAKFKKSSSLSVLKQTASFGDLVSILDDLTKVSTFHSGIVFGNYLPTSYQNLGYLPKGRYIGYADDIKQEINWVISAVRRFKREISVFLQYKRSFEDAFVLGNYIEAENYLEKIEKEICHSLWSFEARSLLLEYQKSPEDSKLFASAFNKNSKGFFTTSLATHTNYKCEKNFSVSKFNTDVQNSIATISGKYADSNKEFYFFKLNFFENKQYKFYKEILGYDSYHSVIDRYLSLVKILKLIYVDNTSTNDLKSFAVTKASYLFNKLSDRELKSLLATAMPEEVEKYHDECFSIQALDYYTSGLYPEAILELKKQILLNPNVFDLYGYYVKAHIYSGIQLTMPNNVKCIQNNILSEIYNQYAKRINPSSTAINILRFVKGLGSFPIGSALHKFYCDEFLRVTPWAQYNLLSLSASNPELSEFYGEEGDKMYFLGNLLSTNEKSITIDFYLQKCSKDFNDAFVDMDIPVLSKNVELAKFYQSSQSYEKAISIWENLMSSVSNIIPVLETGIINLYQCYESLQMFDSAISLYVDNYLKNQYILDKIDCSGLFANIRKNRFRNVTASIDLPIFYTVGEADENELHIAYENYLESLGIEKASDVEISLFDTEQDKLVLFLNKTCTVELFKHSLYINGSKEGITERIAVCRILQTIDATHADLYKGEIDHLTNILIVQEGLQQLDESKIYVNEQGLINNELKEFEGLYIRYKTIAKIFSDNSIKLYFPKTGLLAKIENDSQGDFGSGKHFSTHPLKDTFKEIFDVIVDKFLNSRFGITAYLSTRIRHGVLLGELRPIFEKYNIIAQFDNDLAAYRQVDYWNRKYGSRGQYKLNALQGAIAKFSEKVDDIIYKILKVNLQIRTDESNKEMWLNYFFDDINIKVYSLYLKDASDYRSFIKGVIDIVWERTDQNLEAIRLKIRGEVKDSFNLLISDFTADVQRVFANSSSIGISAGIPEVNTNIITCLTEVQNALDRIANWFNRSGSRTSDFYINKVVDIVLENVNHSFSKRNLELTANIDKEINIKGEYYSHVADLFRIFFDNALTHSVQSKSIIPLEVNVSEDENLLLIEVINNHPDPSKIVSLSQQNEQKINLKRLLSEGKSGFHKVAKIIQADLRNERNECVRRIDNEGRYCVSLKIDSTDLLV